ncbi:ABC1 kinase family protein [Actinomadura rupiterrae]|uniref:ABC1 kinase family protein n=1 Tax=Actinomadura rupiterrae TaxID=559627 RepID=UPI0020A41A2B|nr:AarF/ABC1/UbiB kinase family protein [Actinomadura rupiterrae]MCP2335932.1 ubiquinone biosynthesis protein [Actinomadura rupiterrae]
MGVRLRSAGVSVRRLVVVPALVAFGLVRMAVLVLVARRGRRKAVAADETARLLERLGGTFIKVGQILATRVDLVGETLADGLARLHDDVRPMRPDAAARAVRAAPAELAPGLARAIVDPPVASGSIACVYRVETPLGVVAAKVRRPDVGLAMAADLAFMRRCARLAGMLPPLRRIPLAEMVEQVGACVMRQQDFAAEASNLRFLRERLAGRDGLLVPGVLDERCGPGIIAMEFIDGLDRETPDRLPAPVREAAVGRLVHAVYELLFLHGFVHVDLHQGNAYFLADGRVVLLDAGLCFQLGDVARDRFTRFFAGMVTGDGNGCADVLLSTVRSAAPDADLAAFRAAVADLVVRNARRLARDFNLSAFCIELFNIQRRHRLVADPEFVFPMLSLLTLEGTVRRHHPDMDFQVEAAPYAMQALLFSGELEDQRSGEPGGQRSAAKARTA